MHVALQMAIVVYVVCHIQMTVAQTCVMTILVALQVTKTRDYMQHRILQSCRVWLLLPTTRGTAAKGCSDEQKTWDVRGQVVSHDSLAEFVNSTSLNDAAAAVMATISGLGSTRVIRAGFLRHFLCNFSFIKCICSVHSFIIVFFYALCSPIMHCTGVLMVNLCAEREHLSVVATDTPYLCIYIFKIRWSTK